MGKYYLDRSKGIDISEELRFFRKEKKMTQAELAEKAGISVNSIRRYESGDRFPTVETFLKIMDALGEPSMREILLSNVELVGESGIEDTPGNFYLALGKYLSVLFQNAGYTVTDGKDKETRVIKSLDTGKSKDIPFRKLVEFFNTAQTATETALKMQIDKYMRDDEEQN